MEDDAIDHINWIKYDNNSWPELERRWSKFCNYRLQQNRSENVTTAMILKNWQPYAQPLGYKLVSLLIIYTN